MNKALPETVGLWPTRRLGDVLRLQNGHAFRRADWSDVGLPIIRIQNLKSTHAPFNHFDGELDSKFRAQHGDLLFAWSGTPGTSFGAHVWNGGDAWINQHIFRVDFSADEFDRDFLRLAINSNLDRYIGEANGGVGLAHITKSKLNESQILRPPMDVQRQIADLESSVSTLRGRCSEHVEASNRALRRLRHSVLLGACDGRLTATWRQSHPPQDVSDLLAPAWTRRQATRRNAKKPIPNPHFVEPQEFPVGWATVTLGTVLESIKYGTSAKARYDAPGVAVLRIPNVSGGALDLEDLKQAEISERERVSLALRVGDILLIRSNGSPQLVGCAALVDERATDMVHAGYLMRLRADEALLDPRFLALALASPQVRAQVEMPMRSTSGVNNINSEEVRSLTLLLPPLAEQAEIAIRANALLALADELIGRVDTTSRSLDLVGGALLRKAFRGELISNV